MDLEHPTCQPASQAQEFLSRVLAGPGKVMKYMKAQCSCLISSPWTLQELGLQSALVLQKKKNKQLCSAACLALYEPSGLHEDQKIHIGEENHLRWLSFCPS